MERAQFNWDSTAICHLMGGGGGVGGPGVR